MIDLDWIIKQENELTDRARFDLGDNYHLSIELLELMQSIKNFERINEVSHVFNTQILTDFHLAVLNTLRRHTLSANFLLRHALESLVLFVYSMEYKKETDYGIIRKNNVIVDFDENILKNKAYPHIEKKYPEFSKEIEAYKNVINAFYSHGNGFSGSHNVATIDDRLKALVFDNYFDEAVRDMLLSVNNIMCLTIDLIVKLKEDYNCFEFEENSESTFLEVLNRHERLKQQHLDKYRKDNLDYRIVNDVVARLNKKYNSKKNKIK